MNKFHVVFSPSRAKDPWYMRTADVGVRIYHKILLFGPAIYFILLKC